MAPTVQIVTVILGWRLEVEAPVTQSVGEDGIEAERPEVISVGEGSAAESDGTYKGTYKGEKSD